MRDPRERELAEAVERLTVRHGHLLLEMPFSLVVTLIATIQLALRHPGNVGAAAQAMRSFTEQTIDRLAVDEPRLAEILRLGFDPQHDLPTSRPHKKG